MHFSQLFVVLFLLLMLPCLDSKGGLTPIPTNIPLHVIVTPAIATLYTKPHDWACFGQQVSVFGNGQFDGGFADLVQVSCTSTGALENIAIDPPAPINREPSFISSFVLNSIFWNCSSVNISIGYQGQMRTPALVLGILISQQEMPVLEWEICRETGTVEFFMAPKYGDYSNVHFEDLVLQMDSVGGECGNFLVWEAASWSFSSVPAKRQRIARWKVPETGEWTATLDFMAVQKGTYQLRSQLHAFIEAHAICTSESREDRKCSLSDSLSIPEFVIPEFSIELQEHLVELEHHSSSDSGLEYESDNSKKEEECEITPFLEWNEIDQRVKVAKEQSPKVHYAAIGTPPQLTPRPIQEIALKKHRAPKKQRSKEVSQDSIALGFFEGQSNSTEESFGIEEEPLGFIDPDWRHSIQESNNQKQIIREGDNYLNGHDSGLESSLESPEPLHKYARPRARREGLYEWSVRDSDYRHLSGKKSLNFDSSEQIAGEASNGTELIRKKVRFEDLQSIEGFKAGKQSEKGEKKSDKRIGKRIEKKSGKRSEKKSGNSTKNNSKYSKNNSKHHSIHSKHNARPTKIPLPNSTSLTNDSYFTFSESSTLSNTKISTFLTALIFFAFFTTIL